MRGRSGAAGVPRRRRGEANLHLTPRILRGLEFPGLEFRRSARAELAISRPQRVIIRSSENRHSAWQAMEIFR